LALHSIGDSRSIPRNDPGLLEPRLRADILGSILEAFAEPAAVLGKDGIIIAVNRAWTAVAGGSAEVGDDAEAIGRLLGDRRPRDTAEGIRAVIEGRSDEVRRGPFAAAPGDRRLGLRATPLGPPSAGAVIVLSPSPLGDGEAARAGRCDPAGQPGGRDPGAGEGIFGSSAALREVLERAAQVAACDTTVLIAGETGTGKELTARAIHRRSLRRDGPLVTVNCAAIPAGLVESEVFGHEKGAFTGAMERRIGRFEQADGGTIFLDEVGDLPPDLQVKLLRVLQEGTFERVGSPRTLRTDVRVIAATNRDLASSIRAGTFRRDLYYRLSVFPIRLPTLRERREDIPSLVWHFIRSKEAGMGRRIRRVPPEAMAALEAHDWPGNVRELENVIERALVMSEGEVLVVDEPFLDRRVLPAVLPPARSLEDLERGHILATLRETGWKVKGAGRAAERLGLHPSTLYFRMKKLGIRRGEG